MALSIDVAVRAEGPVTPAEVALVADTRLSREARLVGLRIATGGDDWERITHDEFRVLLGRGPRGLPKDDTLAVYLQELLAHSWIDRKPGGRGSPLYIFTLLPRGGTAYAPLPGEGKENGMPSLEGISPPTMGGHTPPPPPPPLPTPTPISAGARKAIESSRILEGCRDSLVAYLELGRSEHLQAYIRIVEGAIDGRREELWTGARGDRLQEGRAEIVAGCLDDLAQGDEVGKYFLAAPGDFSNLAKKIRYRVKTVLGAKHDGEKRRRAAGNAGTQSGGGAGRAPRGRVPDVRVE